MILLIHIVLALSSIIFSTLSIFNPSQTKLNVTYAMTIGTLITAGMLMFTTNVNFGHLCLSGLTYLGLVAVGIVITRQRLSTQEA